MFKSILMFVALLTMSICELFEMSSDLLLLEIHELSSSSTIDMSSSISLSISNRSSGKWLSSLPSINMASATARREAYTVSNHHTSWSVHRRSLRKWLVLIVLVVLRRLITRFVLVMFILFLVRLVLLHY